MSDDRSQEYQDRIYALYDEWSIDPSAFWEKHPDIGHENWARTNDPEKQPLHASTDAIEAITKHVLWNTGYSFSPVDSGVRTKPGIKVYKK